MIGLREVPLLFRRRIRKSNYKYRVRLAAAAHYFRREKECESQKRRPLRVIIPTVCKIAAGRLIRTA